MSLRRRYIPAPGLVEVLRPRDGLEMISLSILRLEPGTRHHLRTGGREHALVVLGGSCAVTGDGFAFAGVGGRRDVFAGKPHAVCLPAEIETEVSSDGGAEIAVCSAPGEPGRAACHIRPERVGEKALGKGAFTRRAHIVVDETVDCVNLFIGEAYVPPGNWASFPPHRHDFDRLPTEVDMEELYFFRFDPPEGFGLQCVYNDARTLDTALPVRHDDAALLPEGYHPVANAPGYSMYYLWIMAGRNRRFLSSLDPAHRWIAG